MRAACNVHVHGELVVLPQAAVRSLTPNLAAAAES